MSISHTMTLACDDRPGGAWPCTATYSATARDDQGRHAVLLAARQMGWTQSPMVEGGYADRCPACSLLAASNAPAHDQHSCRLSEAEPIGRGVWRCVDCEAHWRWDATLPGWRRIPQHICPLPAFDGTATDARTGETFTCPTCDTLYVADRESESWSRTTDHGPLCAIPLSADPGKPWPCHCGQLWEYSQDVKAWTKMGYEE